MQVQTESNKITSQQIKLIHTLKGKLGLADDVYRSMLSDYHVFSSTQLTAAGADQFIYMLEKNAERAGKWTRPFKKYANLTGRRGMATPKQLRMIEGMWRDVSNATTGIGREAALKTFLSRFGVTSIESIEYWQVSKVVNALQAMKGGKTYAG